MVWDWLTFIAGGMVGSFITAGLLMAAWIYSAPPVDYYDED